MCILPKNRPIMVPIAGFSTKSTPSAKYLQFVHISSFFHFFPKSPLRSDRELGTHMAICPMQSWRPAGDRERPCFRPVPPYANFLLLLAVGYMRLIFPGTGYMAFIYVESDRHFKPQFFKHLSRSETLFMRGR